MVCALCCGCGVKRGLREVQSRIEPRLSVCAARNSTSPKVPGNPQTSHAILLMPLCLHVLEVGTQECKKMRPSPLVRLRIVAWVVTFLLPVAAWRLTGATWPWLHPGVGIFFVLAAGISAALGGLPTASVAALLNVFALNAYSYLYRAPVPHVSEP